MKKISPFCIALSLIFILFLLTSHTLAQDVNPPILPVGAKARLGKGRIKDMQFSADGTWIAASSNTGVWIYDAQTGKALSKFTEAMDWVIIAAFSPETKAFAFSPDGTRVAVGGSDGVAIYDAHTGEALFTLTRPGMPDTSQGAEALAFSPDGETLVIGDNISGVIYLWDVHAGNWRGRLGRHKAKVRALTFSPDGKKLASGTHGEICLWDVALQLKRLTFNRYTNKVLALAFLADGKTLASADKDGTLRLWDADTGELRTSFTRLMENPKALAFSPNGTTLTAANWAGNLQAWKTATGHEIFSRLTGHTGVVSTLAFTPNGETIASGGWDGTLRIWDVATRNMQQGNEAGDATANWEFVHSTEDYTLRGGAPWEVEVSADGSTFAGGTLADDVNATIQLWDAVTGKQTGTIVPKHTRSEWVLAISPDGTRLASGGRDGKILIMDTGTGKELASLTEHTDRISTLMFSPDGTRLASSGEDAKLLLWDVDTGNTILTLNDECGQLAFSSDGKILASAGAGVKLWNIETGLLMVTLSKHEVMLIEALTFSPDGKALLGAGSGFKVWDVATGNLIADLTEYFHAQRLGRFLTVVFSPDGETLASGGWDGIFLWEWDKIASWGIPVDEENDLFSP